MSCRSTPDILWNPVPKKYNKIKPQGEGIRKDEEENKELKEGESL